MLSFFRQPGISRSNNQNILVLIRSMPHFPRGFTTLSSTAQPPKYEFHREEALNKYGLSNLKLVWPKRAVLSDAVNYTDKNPHSISQMYGNADLSKVPIFQGGFINFGYWPVPFFTDNSITVEQRIASAQEMYKVIGNLAKILKGHNVAEIGCGLGYGSALISQHYGTKLVVGVDISPDQIARAKVHQVAGISSGKLRFTLGEAESMPFTEGTFDCVISVEASQHFNSMGAFSKEVSRVLKPNGRLVMTSFFPQNKEGVEALNAIVPDYHIHGSQNTISDVAAELAANLDNVKVTSIGENVWHGFSRWLDQIGYHNQWSKVWGALYSKGLIDYVVYEADAPKMSSSPSLQLGRRN